MDDLELLAQLERDYRITLVRKRRSGESSFEIGTDVFGSGWVYVQDAQGRVIGLSLSGGGGSAPKKLLDELPPQVLSMSALVYLDLRGNAIDSLPQELFDLKAWTISTGPTSAGATGAPYLGVAKNPLASPPLEVLDAGIDAVRSYFSERNAQGTDSLYEAKVLIVGEGGAGKSSLVRRLYLPHLPLPEEEQTTRGIDIHRHDIKLGDARDMRLNVWDFGGQQIYHATHQFFLTKSSLYVIVDDTRRDHKTAHDEGFKYWLEVIETLSDHSPVLIFQNEKGGRSKNIDLVGIKRLFDGVKDVYGGDLADPASADDLRRAIELNAQQLPHIGEQVPAKWLDIRADLEAMATTTPHITEDAYYEVYRRHLEFDRTKALHLSQYLHNLGVFLHFQDDARLKRTVILQNGWATEAVFRILDDEQIKAKLGRFTRADCTRLWPEPKYAHMHQELLALMEKFELCYFLPDTDDDTWLAPQLLLPSVPEELSAWDEPGDLVLTHRYAFLPRGIVNRLMVRMHRFVSRPEMAWASGVLFEKDQSQLLARVSPSGGGIDLRARGPERKFLMSVIASDLDALNGSFKGLADKVRKLVPCVCAQCASTTEPELFDESRLLKRRRDDRLTVECPASYEDVSVLELLDGLVMSIPSDWSPEKSEARTIKIFLASSEELRDHRDAFELYFRQQNDRLLRDGVYLEIVRWENSLDAMSRTRLQDEYNRLVRDCDMFVSLFRTKTGRFTEEEFDVAHEAFLAHGKPLIYTFFHNSQVSTNPDNRAALTSLWNFQKRLEDLGHFWTTYDNIEHLKRQFRDQLEVLRRRLS